MPRPNLFMWSNQTPEEKLAQAQRASREDLRSIARACDWSDETQQVLGWIMANRVIDLSTALTVFFNGDPARFNYISKKQVPLSYQATTSLLDNICLRVNSGFYRVAPGHRVDNLYRLHRWLKFQNADRNEGRQGRWILDEQIVAQALNARACDTDIPDISAIRPLPPKPSGQKPVRRVITQRVVELFAGLIPGSRAG